MTPKFNKLDLTNVQFGIEYFIRMCPSLLRHTKHLLLAQNLRDGGCTLPLPRNIAVIETGRRSRHLCPDLIEYHLVTCKFFSSSTIDLGHLTVLVVKRQLVVYTGVKVTLQSLRELSVGTIHVLFESSLSCPILETFHVLAAPNDFESSWRIGFLRASLLSTGLCISHGRSVKVDLCLPLEVVVWLLESLPDVESLLLSFEDRDVMDSVLVAISEIIARNGRTCSMLVDLGLRALWKSEEVNGCEERVIKIIGAGQGAPRVYVSRTAGGMI